MRTFNWERVPQSRVLGRHNIWTERRPPGDYALDTQHMEELFSKRQQENKQRSSIRGQRAQVFILSSKRSMNVGIFLKQFRRPVGDMIDDITTGSSLIFGSEKLRELFKLLPNDDEVKELRSFRGDHGSVPDADLFMLKLVEIPSYEDRLNCLVLREEFFPIVEELKAFVGTLVTAGKELLQSEQLHSVIRLVLKTGNYMNAGGYAGSAVGFRMTSLLKLVDTKANKPGMNLMHYVVIQAQKADPELLTFPEQLQHIEAAARIHRADVEAEFSRQRRRVHDARESWTKQNDLRNQMEDFLQGAELRVHDMDAQLQTLSSVSDSVAQYFCEDPRSFKLDECCSIFSSFCQRFIRANQENKGREASEVKRRHAERLQTALKRRSIASCSTRDKDMDNISLESVLQSFISKSSVRRKAGRPFSSHGTPPNGSPLSGSPLSGSPLSGSPLSGSPLSGSPSATPNRSPRLKLKDMSKKEWNSAADLTEAQRRQPRTLDASKPVALKNTTPDSSDRTLPSTSPPPSHGEPHKETFQDNSVEEAQMLREASRKVLKFQNSRGSVSSLESVEKGPGIQRQRTIDEDLGGNLDQLPDGDLETLFAGPPSPSKRNLGRRYTLPSKVPKTHEGGSSSAQRPDGDTNDLRPLTVSGTPLQDGNQGVGASEQSDDSPPKSAQTKTEPTGLLFNFLRRFQFPTSKSSDSSV